MPTRGISVAAIGKFAQGALAQAQPASVMGKTSRGLFLRLASGWVIFLSFEIHRGPLSLNLQDSPEPFADLEMGSTVRCSPTELIFPTLRLSLPLAQAEPWQAPAPPVHVLTPDTLRDRLLEVLDLATLGHPRLLTQLHNLVVKQTQPADQNLEFDPLLRRLQTACHDRQAQAITHALEPFLGLGPGLTPSGDDLVLGFLLTMNRWGQQLSLNSEITPARGFLNREIPARAGRRTSALSANLIECAASGQADERLILALDGIVTGNLPAQACVTALSGWGSSSGFDALAGMALVLLVCFPPKDSNTTHG